MCIRDRVYAVPLAESQTAAKEYKYSSAKFYQEGIDEFNMITHYTGN